MSVTSRGEAKEKVREAIGTIVNIPAEQLDDEVLIRDELGIDSLRALEMISACERALNVEIDEANCAEMETVGEFVSHVADVWRSSNDME